MARNDGHFAKPKNGVATKHLFLANFGPCKVKKTKNTNDVRGEGEIRDEPRPMEVFPSKPTRTCLHDAKAERNMEEFLRKLGAVEIRFSNAKGATTFASFGSIEEAERAALYLKSPECENIIGQKISVKFADYVCKEVSIHGFNLGFGIDADLQINPSLICNSLSGIFVTYTTLHPPSFAS